jgi:histidine triad (HIT) family protein
MTDCIFCKIVKGELPSYKVYEDAKLLAFLDISPVNPGHVLLIPKHHHKDFLDMPDELVATLFTAAKRISEAVVAASGAAGFNIGMNNGTAAGQAVFHAHLHIMPRLADDGLHLWPGKKYAEGEAEQARQNIIQHLPRNL